MRKPPGKISKTLILILAAGCLASCEKPDKLAVDATNSMDTETYGIDFTVNASDLSGFQIFSEDTCSYDLNTLLAQAGLDPGQLEEVILKEASMSLEENTDYPDFDMLGSIELTVYTDLLGETSVASTDPVPADRSTLNLDPEEVNILPYFMEGMFIITVQGVLKQRVYEDLDLHAKLKFRVKWKL